MFQLTYASTAAKLFSAAELLKLLPAYRENNLRLNVTGLLLYKQGSFMQALEGEEDTVRALYDKIRKDTRHHHVLTLAAITIAERQFPRWSMGFEALGDMEIGPIPGYDPDLKFPPMSDELPWKAAVALRLLSTFMKES